MTVAATEAMTLHGLLARHAVPDARRYFRAIAAAIDVAWDIAVGADLAFPQVPGERTAKVRLVNAYMPRLHAAAAHDATLAAALVRVIGLKDRPEGLLRPDRVLRVLRGNLANRRRPAPAPAGQAPAATPAERPMQPTPLQGKPGQAAQPGAWPLRPEMDAAPGSKGRWRREMSWRAGRRKDPACSTTEPQGLCTVRITAIPHSRFASNGGQACGYQKGSSASPALLARLPLSGLRIL